MQGHRTNKHAAAVETFLGHHISVPKETAGKTDREIVCELLEIHGTELCHKVLDRVLEILDALSVEEINRNSVSCVPGVTHALRIASSAGWVHGLLTGNTPVRGRTKLTAAGILSHFDLDFAYFGESTSSRYELVGQVAAKITSDASLEVVIVGDTPLDILSAHKHNLRVIATATGLYAVEELEVLNPSLILTGWTACSNTFVDYLNSLVI